MVFDLNSKSLKSTRYCTLNISVHGLKFARDLILGCVIELHLLDFLIVFFFSIYQIFVVFFFCAKDGRNAALKWKKKQERSRMWCAAAASATAWSVRGQRYANVDMLISMHLYSFENSFLLFPSLSVRIFSIWESSIYHLNILCLICLHNANVECSFTVCVCVLCGAQCCIALYHTIIIMQ